MSDVQRWDKDGFPDPDGIFVYADDHARIVAEMEQAHAAALAEAAERQRARDYVSLWARIMLEDRKYRAALARAALVIRQRLTDSDVFRLTGQHVRLHEWETVKPLPAGAAAAPRTLTADDLEPAVGSVVLDADGDAWQRTPNGWAGPADMGDQDWRDVLICFGPVTLIHDSGKEGE